MTTASNSAILDPVTNPVPTVAPQSKEDTTMSGATNKITALYCRLSQEDARLGESLSIENQKAILLEYAKKNHFPNPVFFVDDGYSGTNYDRPGFQSMLVEIEAGRVGIVITKDLSRLGRNSALTGLYTNFTFPQYGVRYIAINDNYDTIDPNSVNNDFAGIKNWFNEFYARDTSRKIRAVQKAKGERGVPLTVNVPYGYVKDPENPKHWLVDPEAAAVVKRIFSMCMEGRGPTQIANQLWVDKVLTPTAYKLSHGRSTNAPAPEDPYRWDKRAVSLILERREYTGCTVNFKTYTNSIWDKKRHLNPVENQAIFPDTHERIIDDDVFEKVQEIRSQRHRMTRTGKSSIFSGMVYCADCGSKMQYGSSNNRDFSQDFFDCSLHKKNGSKCKGHFIRVKVLEGRVLSHAAGRAGARTGQPRILLLPAAQVQQHHPCHRGYGSAGALESPHPWLCSSRRVHAAAGAHRSCDKAGPVHLGIRLPDPAEVAGKRQQPCAGVGERFGAGYPELGCAADLCRSGGKI